MDSDIVKEQKRLWQYLQDMRAEGKDPYNMLEPTATLLLIDIPPFEMPPAAPPLAPMVFPQSAPLSQISYVDRDIEKGWSTTLDSLSAVDDNATLLSVQAWQAAKAFLQPRSLSDPLPVLNEAVEYSFVHLQQRNLFPSLLRYWKAALNACFTWIEQDVKVFMAQWQNKMALQTVSKLLLKIHEWYLAWSQTLEAFKADPAFQKHARGAYMALFRSRFLAALPPSINLALRLFLRATLADLPSYAQMFGIMDIIGMTERFDKTFIDVLYDEIEAKITESCPGKWAEPKLEGLRKMAKELEEKWLTVVYGSRFIRTENNDWFKGAMMMVSGRLDYFLCRNLIELRTSEIFEIVVEFPESLPAVNDLRACLFRSFFRTEFVQGLQEVISRRILQPAADTDDIITFYVSLIRCLRVIDPQGVILHKVAGPIRKYLRDRPDAVRCIVKRMTDENESFLEQGEQVVPIQQVHEQYDDYSDPYWIPEPTDAGADFRTSRPMDIVSTLVSIYDTQDLFIKELQHILAGRLLAIRNTPLDEEIKNIEMLKMRFGEVPLQVCAVMLKDMTDSRRMNAHINSNADHPLYPTVISQLFWPSIQPVPLQMPGQFKELQDTYAAGFQKFKPDKKLRWLPQLGAVSLELELQDRTVEVEATPIQAAVIELFSVQAHWDIEHLIAHLGGLEKVLVQSALDFWIGEGVVKNMGDHYELLEEAEVARGTTRARRVYKEEEPAVDEIEKQQAAQMKMYWQYIQGMLSNFPSLPIDKIQAMMKFAPGYDRSVQELGVFLESARKEGLVLFVNGSWKLAKK